MSTGSSPLARGLPPSNFPSVGGGGIIPARAGFTSPRGRGSRGGADHPRSRGVYFGKVDYITFNDGSSPLARGLPIRPGQTDHAVGIIPARAGFTNDPLSRLVRSSDHPRSRGVYKTRVSPHKKFSGSSPLARGLRPRRIAVRLEGRIIPARAGFTRPPDCLRCRLPDHPRSRGVYHPVWSGVESHFGSSPLARGLLDHRAEPGVPDRIIPARAGFTSRASTCPRSSTDHPRSRGVYPVVPVPHRRIPGSSPLARGLPPRGRRKYGRSRIIPARAGFTST